MTLTAEKMERFIFLLSYALGWYSYMKCTKQFYEDPQECFSYDQLEIELSDFVSSLLSQPRCQDLILIDFLVAHQLQEHYLYVKYAFRAYVEGHDFPFDEIIDDLVNSINSSSEAMHPSAKLYQLVQREDQVFSPSYTLSPDLQLQFKYFIELSEIFRSIEKILYT